MDKIRVAFIYKGSNKFMTGKHFDNVYYNFFMKALRRNNEIEMTYFPEENKIDTSQLKNKIDVVLLWQNNEFGTPDLVGIRDLNIPVIARCADPREAKTTIAFHKKWKIDYYIHFWPESFFHSILPKEFKYKSIIYGIEPSLYQNLKPFSERIKNKILNSGAVGNSKFHSRIINSLRNPKWNAFSVYHLRTICNKLPYVDYFPTLQTEYVNDRYPLLLQKYQASIAACTYTTVAKMWEIPAAGCLSFLEVNEKNDASFVGFKDGETAIFINEKNFRHKFQAFLNSTEDPEWQKIAERGRKFVMENLTNDHAVISLVHLMKDILEGKKGN